MSENNVETTKQTDGTVITKLSGHADAAMIKAILENIPRHVGRSDPTDWIIDALSVDDIESELPASLTEMFLEIKKQNVRHIALVSTKSSVRMIVSTAGFAASAGLMLANTHEEALEAIESRIKKGA